MTSFWRNADIRTTLDGLLDLFDAGAGAGEIRIYSGTAPADADAALSGNTLLVTLTFTDPAFANSVDSNPGATATASAIASGTCVAAGTATFFRVLDSNGVVRAQGLVSTSGAEMNFVLVGFVVGLIVSVTAMTVFMAESAA